MPIRTHISLALVATLTLGACAPTTSGQSGEQNRTRDGAVIGGALGAMAGLISGDDAGERRRGAAIGAALGAGVGAAIGNQLDRQAAELEQNLDNRVGVVNTGDRLIVTMPQDLLFDVDSALVQPNLRSDLRLLAASLQDYPNTTVDIIGHTDNTGPADYNQNLSARRAASVAAILSDSGVQRSRLRAFGRGEDAPIASNLTPEGRAQNRRVEIVIRPMT